MPITWSRQALRDLAEIHEFLQGENPAAARRMLAVIRASASHLAQFPRAGRAHPSGDMRIWVVPRTPFVIDYRSSGDRVDVLAVTHGALRR